MECRGDQLKPKFSDPLPLPAQANIPPRDASLTKAPLAASSQVQVSFVYLYVMLLINSILINVRFSINVFNWRLNDVVWNCAVYRVSSLIVDLENVICMYPLFVFAVEQCIVILAHVD